ncbi:MAG TPA: hypothetical protein DEB17_09365 [Chlorobaculum sp.]|uniref:Uncharacterized protein n=1 Tax=Chlorobaculum tepidum (strain ATCC 49652 / DSM 12025 / NBRC 103806 / TLS) TaxID=194439 RepID=Q8KBB7_CHLTE|nr:hypothetical protein CT1872 [Chlorobaculum tepidum TLS]HBU24176.1 hypothetical protein [Chlorobaculum sp.]
MPLTELLNLFIRDGHVSILNATHEILRRTIFLIKMRFRIVQSAERSFFPVFPLDRYFAYPMEWLS